SPIRHVVVILQENHSFDNVLGLYCSGESATSPSPRMACDGATQGVTASGQVLPLPAATDQVPEAAHTVFAQQQAIDGGRMDGFSLIAGCRALRCYQQFAPAQIPN